LLNSGSQKSTVILAGALACVACTRQTQVAPLPGSNYSVPVVMERQVKNAADAGEGDSELRTLRTRLAANPTDLDARVLLARLYQQRGLTDLALEHYRLAAVQFPQSAVVHLELAKTLRQMGVPAEALRVVREFVESQPKADWETLSLEAVLEDEQGQFVAAESAHRAAVALAPDRSSLHNNLGYNLLSQGHTDDAVAEFRRALELDPKSEIAHNNLGAALAARPGDASKDALAEFVRSGRQAEAHNNLAAVLMEQHRYAEARTQLQAALKAQPGMPAALANWKLVAEFDGGSATPVVAAPAPKQTSAQNRRSVWAKLFHKKPATKPGDNAAAVAAPPANAVPEETAAKK
jgi:Flp pilus assembly protein TadD